MSKFHEEVLRMTIDTLGLETFGGRKEVRKHRKEHRLFKPLKVDKHPNLLNTFHKHGFDFSYHYFLLSCSTISEAMQSMHELGYQVTGDNHHPYAETSGQLLQADLVFKVVGNGRVLVEQYTFMDC